MKKINVIKAFILFVSALAVSSCSSDGGGESNGTTTGNYWPMAVNNVWNFDASGTTEQLKITGTSVFGGTTYYELHDEGDDSSLDIQNWIVKKGATYYQKIADVSTVESGVSITIKGYQVPLFRDDLEVDETWSGSVHPKVTYSYNGTSGSLPTTVTYNGEITARGGTETINSVVYNNVIKMRVLIETDVDGQTNTIDYQYWFAKDIGPIKEISITDGGTPKERLLLNYTLN